MRDQRVKWLIVALAGTALEMDALRHSRKDATLSHATRNTFQTDSAIGRLVFTAAWTAMYAWFLGHILGGKQ